MDPLSSEEIAAKESQLLQQIPISGSIGNAALSSLLSWDEELFLFIRNRLRDSGKLFIGRGRGGSIRRAIAENLPLPNGKANKSKELGREYSTEDDLYQPILKLIKDRWVADEQFDQFAAEVTARGGRRSDGVWSRPDITVAAVTSYPYLPGKYLDIITFEIKPLHAVDVTAIYEALAHRRASTKSYVVCHVPDQKLPDLEGALDDMASEARRHGIGFIVVGDPRNYDSWDFREDAERNDADPARMNQFVQSQLSELMKDSILKWMK